MRRKIKNITYHKLISENFLHYDRDYPFSHGAFGTVYRGTYQPKPKSSDNQKQPKEIDCAIKVLTHNDLSNAKDQELFYNELRCQCDLDHIAILPLLGYCLPRIDSGLQLTIVTPFVPNGSLHSILDNERKGQIANGWNETKRIINAFGIAAGMSYVHKHKIIHRDLKSENVLIDENCYPKICDFGLSKIVMNDVNQTVLVGTPLYMAPEILQRRNDYTNKVDVFAYSMILYELFSLEVPWMNSRETLRYSVIDFIQSGLRPTLFDMIPPFFKNVIVKCWAQNAEERPTFDDIIEYYIVSFNQMISELHGNIDVDEFRNYITNSTKDLGIVIRHQPVPAQTSYNRPNIVEMPMQNMMPNAPIMQVPQNIQYNMSPNISPNISPKITMNANNGMPPNIQQHMMQNGMQQPNMNPNIQMNPGNYRQNITPTMTPNTIPNMVPNMMPNMMPNGMQGDGFQPDIPSSHIDYALQNNGFQPPMQPFQHDGYSAGMQQQQPQPQPQQIQFGQPPMQYSPQMQQQQYLPQFPPGSIPSNMRHQDGMNLDYQNQPQQNFLY
ncbi:hypothetical protein TRFO_27933 [Tritrichomonas foetus]|uniref:Protein kinase domain-containing protein n=1 Tax=Tritrichomonas foetus TaxID=1144522 RepID=A0A1J4JZE7_9EUKA|nr:hypothetical protein TRFO_27933 [Tritrichomonas foetus]|eukprot:OHT04551.1 hypothetical protein TRFO_27933 [Tritrichomonas foetus]